MTAQNSLLHIPRLGGSNGNVCENAYVARGFAKEVESYPEVLTFTGKGSKLTYFYWRFFNGS